MNGKKGQGVESMFCKKCGAQISEQDKFCKGCGAPVTPQTNAKFCMSCGMKMEKDQIFCTQCGTRFGGDTQVRATTQVEQPEVGQKLMKSYPNMYYAVGDSKAFNNKLCTIVLRENRIDIQKNSTTPLVLGGAVGGLIAGAVEGSIAASGGRRPDVTIFYQDILQITEGKHGLNNTIRIVLYGGQTYTLLVGNKQQEILSLIRGNMR